MRQPEPAPRGCGAIEGPAGAGRWPGAGPRARRPPEPVPTAEPGPGPAALAADEGGAEPFPAEVEWARRTPVSKRITEEDRFALADQRNLVASRRGRRDVSYPVVGVRGDGARFTDADGRGLLDLCMGFGVLLLGHTSEPLTAALRSFEPSDMLFGPQSSTAGDVARGIASLAGVDRVAFTSSGTEAVMGAVRTARAKTGRDLVALFSGSYHGTFDGVLVAPRAGGERGDDTPRAGHAGRRRPGRRPVAVRRLGAPAPGVLRRAAGRGAGRAGPEPAPRPPTGRPAAPPPLADPRPGRSARLRRDHHRLPVPPGRCGRAVRGPPGPRDLRQGHRRGAPIGVIAGDAAFMAPIDGGRWREGDVGFPQRPSMVFAGTFSKHPLAMAVAQQMIWHLRKVSPAAAGIAGRPDRRSSREDQRPHGRPRVPAVGRALLVAVPHRRRRPAAVRGDVLPRPPQPGHLRVGGAYVLPQRRAHRRDCAEIAEAVADNAAEVAAQGLWGAARPARVLVPAPGRPAATDTVPAPAPLTDGQKLLWMASELGGELGESYRMSDRLRIEGTLDPARLRAAIGQVARRHEALRIGFDEDGGSQRCVPGAVPELTVIPSADASPDEAEALLSGACPARPTCRRPRSSPSTSSRPRKRRSCRPPRRLRRRRLVVRGPVVGAVGGLPGLGWRGQRQPARTGELPRLRAPEAA